MAGNRWSMIQVLLGAGLVGVTRGVDGRAYIL